MVVMDEADRVVIDKEMVSELQGSKIPSRRSFRRKPSRDCYWTSLDSSRRRNSFVEALKNERQWSAKIDWATWRRDERIRLSHMSYARSHSRELGIEQEWFDRHDVHIHFCWSHP